MLFVISHLAGTSSSTSRPKVTEIACITRPKLCATFQLLWDIIWCRAGSVCVVMGKHKWDWRFGVGASASFLGKTGGTHQRYISLANRAVGPTYVWRRKLMHQARSPELWLRSRGNCKGTKRNILVWETTDPSPWRLVPRGLDLHITSLVITAGLLLGPGHPHRDSISLWVCVQRVETYLE